MSDINQVLEAYLSGSYEGDTAKFRSAFHSQAHVYGMDMDGKVSAMTIDDFVAMISGHPSVKDAGQAREDEVLAIDYTGDNAAVARVKLRLGDTVFTDALNLLRIDGRWGIIAKMYSGASI